MCMQSIVMVFVSVCVRVDLGIVFASMPPSLLACACISDAVRHLGYEKYSKCVNILAELTNIDRVSEVKTSTFCVVINTLFKM